MGDAIESSACAIMKTWFQRVWTDGDPSAIEELLAPDGVVHGLGPDPVTGPAEFRGFWEAIQASFDTIRVQVVDGVDEGARGWVRCVADGAAQGRPVTFSGGCQVAVEDGLIKEAWNYWDFVGCMHQMGALPADAFAQACGGMRWM